MNYMNISALKMEEAELMVKTIDKWIRFHFNLYGVQRDTSFNARANAGRAQVRVKIHPEVWAYIKSGAMSEIVNLLNKDIQFHVEHITKDFQVLDLSTSEAEI